jgi:hypothetical protein
MSCVIYVTYTHISMQEILKRTLFLLLFRPGYMDWVYEVFVMWCIDVSNYTHVWMNNISPHDTEDLYLLTCTTKRFQPREKSHEKQRDVFTITN